MNNYLKPLMGLLTLFKRSISEQHSFNFGQRFLLPSLFFFFSFTFIIPPPVQAEMLTLEEALRLTVKHNQKINTARAQEQGTRAALTTALAYPNPEIEVAAGSSYSRQSGGNSGPNGLVGLSQPLELPSLRSARRKGAEAGLISGTAALGDVRLTQLTAVKQAFFDVLRKQEEARLAKENRALLLQIRHLVKIKVEVGESPRYELVKSEAEVLSAESNAKSADLRVIQARDRLRALIGAPLSPKFNVADEPFLAAALPSLDELRQELLNRQPLLKLAEAEKERASARLEYERASRLPQPTIKVSADQEPDINQWRVGLTLPLPLWNRRQGPIAEATAGVQKAEAELQQIRQVLLGELDQVYGRYQIAERQVQIFESGLLNEAEKAMKVAEAAYRYGERGIIDYLDAQRVLRTTRLDFLNARYELQAALIEMERLRAVSSLGGGL
jgi:cobalt-zinc-cadmium efflux system outer membrane protein